MIRLNTFSFLLILLKVVGGVLSDTVGRLREKVARGSDSSEDIQFNQAGIGFSRSRSDNPNINPSDILEQHGLEENSKK